jgi:choline-glycine betaine transporter
LLQLGPSSGCTIANSDYIAARYVLGQVIYVSPALGTAYTFISHPATMFLVVLLPLGAIAVLSAIDFVKAAKMKPEANDEEEKQKMMKQEMLEQIKKQIKNQIGEDLNNNDEERDN